MTRPGVPVLVALAVVPAIAIAAFFRPTETGDLCQRTGTLTQASDYAAMAAQAFTGTAWAEDGATVIHVLPGALTIPAQDGTPLLFPGHFAEISGGDIVHVAPFEVEGGESLVQLRSPEVSAQLQFEPCGGMVFQQWYAPRDDEAFDWSQAPLGN